MPYININEYDYTITGPKNYSGNVVAIPINANDGPSDRWVTVHTYDEFIQTFGNNPNTSSAFGNSWEYAANLLLRGMSVCVRRITNVLSDDGENTAELLADVNTAKAIIKIKDVVGSETAGTSSLAEGLITVTDIAQHSVLKNSLKGEEIDNPLYKYYTYEEDGETKRSAYANVHILQTDETNRIVGAFADVITTNSEWNYAGKFINPHYKYQKSGDTTPMAYIQRMNQTEDANGNAYVIGDFFINEANHIVKFSPTPLLNEYWISGQKQYPDDLKSIKTENLTENHFVDVTFNANNTKAVNLVWTYSESGTTVINHKFVNGNISISGNDSYKLFETNADLPTENVGVNYFAPVQSTNTIWIYNGQDWANTGASLESLTTIDSDYAIEVTIPFVCTNKAINTDIYKHYFNWENTGEEVYIDIDNPELAYVPTLYWTNSNNPIGTRPHTILSGAAININDIVINTNADTTKSAITLQVNGHQDIIIDKDYTDTRLISGNYGITNVSDEPIKIYGFRITQKADNGEVTLVYDACIEKVINSLGRITTDPLLKVYNTVTGEYLSDPIPKLDSTTSEDKWYIELDPGCMIYYNRSLTGGVFNLKVAGFNNFEIVCHTFNTSSGSYDIALTALENTIAEVIKHYIPVISEEEIDYEDIPVKDANQNFNLFTVEYLCPGSNGNALNVKVKTIVNQGIYLYVYRNKQYLEKIELCSFRFRNGDTGRVNILDMDLNKDAIWRTILSKFGVLILEDGIAYDTNLVPITKETVLPSIYGNYIKIDLNKNIVIETPISLDYVYSLYAQSGNVITSLTGGSNPSDEHVIHEVPKCYEPLKDKYRYDIKFITNGTYIDKITYPKDIVSSLATDTDVRLIEDALIDLATTRKDCVAFLDVPYDLPLEDVPYYFEHISTSYAAAYDPWAYIILGTGSTKWMPPSFVQLYTHAKSIQNGNKLYLPPAGVRRAQVPEILKTNHDLTSNYITAWQDNSTPQFINPIIWINGYDFTIYGQKTLYNIINESDKYQSALQDLNVRLVANEIKKLIFKTCIELTFELNNIMTWNEFKSKLEPTLSTMHGEGVLTDYNVIMGTETMTAADLNSGHIVGTVRVSIARAATDWDINFELTPNGVTFTEYDYNSTYSE